MADQATPSRPRRRAATVQPQQYENTGWAEGQNAPEDLYVQLDQAGEPVEGSASNTPPEGYGRQVAVKGDVVTRATLRAKAAAEGKPADDTDDTES